MMIEKNTECVGKAQQDYQRQVNNILTRIKDIVSTGINVYELRNMSDLCWEIHRTLAANGLRLGEGFPPPGEEALALTL
jgi:hypothetical protein